MPVLHCEHGHYCLQNKKRVQRKIPLRQTNLDIYKIPILKHTL